MPHTYSISLHSKKKKKNLAVTLFKISTISDVCDSCSSMYIYVVSVLKVTSLQLLSDPIIMNDFLTLPSSHLCSLVYFLC